MCAAMLAYTGMPGMLVLAWSDQGIEVWHGLTKLSGGPQVSGYVALKAQAILSSQQTTKPLYGFATLS